MMLLSVWLTPFPIHITMTTTPELLVPAESVSCTQNRHCLQACMLMITRQVYCIQTSGTTLAPTIISTSKHRQVGNTHLSIAYCTQEAVHRNAVYTSKRDMCTSLCIVQLHGTISKVNIIIMDCKQHSLAPCPLYTGWSSRSHTELSD